MKFKSKTHFITVLLFGLLTVAFFIAGFFNWIHFALSVFSAILASMLYYDDIPEWKKIDRYLLIIVKIITTPIGYIFYILSKIFGWMAIFLWSGFKNANRVLWQK